MWGENVDLPEYSVMMNEGNSEVFSKKLRSTSKCLNMLAEHSRGPVEGAAEDRLNVCVFTCVCVVNGITWGQ